MIRIATIACFALTLCACAGQQQTARLPSAPPPGEPAGIAGLNTQQLRVAFGAPVFVRKDGDIEMWRYDSANCKAFFFLYPDPAGLSVRHVETLPRPSDAAADTVCLNRLRVGGQPVS
jgi:hypothetical protein